MSETTPTPIPGHGTATRLRRLGALLAHLGLLLLISWMLVFLAGKHGPRIDLTSEGLYSLTRATEVVLEGLDERLRIEVYLSADDELPAAVRSARRSLREVLDEFEARGDGLVTLRFLDPQQSDEIRQRATRLGIQPQRVRDMQGTTLAQKEIWQGVRFLYGGERQKVLPYLGFDDRTAAYEEVLTRTIQAVQVLDRPKVGVLAWRGPNPGAVDGVSVPTGEGARGYLRVLAADDINDRYELVPVDLRGGELLPDDLDTVVLIRPRLLTDRQKFVLDQFVMRGGRLAIFADTADVALGGDRLCRVAPAAMDDPESESTLIAMLGHYGLEVNDEVVFDQLGESMPFVVETPAPPGAQVRSVPLRLPYPYWFRPSTFDWAEQAEVLARRSDGRVDEQLAENYRRLLKPGVAESVQSTFVPPVMFWPCSVKVAEALPAEVSGEVLMRTSPRAARHDPLPHQDLRPVPVGPFREADYRSFEQRIRSYMQGERDFARQFGLMAMVEGRLPSFFATRDVPLRPGEQRETPAADDPLAEPLGGDPLGGDEGGTGGDQPELAGPEIAGPEIAGPGLDEAGDAGAGAPRRSDGVLRVAGDGARVVVVGDADFLRDDIVGGEYVPMGGPSSPLGRLFFLHLLDWLAGNEELLALRTREFVDRTQRYVDETAIADLPPPQQEEARRDAVSRARALNLILPPLLLTLFGIAWQVHRSRAKRAFLQKVGGR